MLETAIGRCANSRSISRRFFVRSVRESLSILVATTMSGETSAESQRQGEIDSFAAEMVDRFGKMPAEAEFLLNTVALKLLCRAAGVERIDAGEKAVVLSLHDNKFANPDKLIAWLQKNAPLVRLRPDHRVMVQRVWNDERQRLSGVTSIVSALAKLAA